MPVAVVTGAASGIGRATALHLARLGYTCVLHTRRNLRGLFETAAEFEQISRRSSALNPVSVRPKVSVPTAVSQGAPSHCLTVTADVACCKSCEDLVRAAFAWQGRVDTWINNAGADVLTTQLKSSSFDKKLEQLLQVDLLGTIRLSRLVADRLVAQSQSEKSKPSIINIGWDQAATGMEGEPGQLFCTTKAAVEAFSKALALTIGPHVRVNTVAPGWIKTKWGENTEGYWNHRAQAESILERWGHPDDVAAAIGWLASSGAEFVNAQTLKINGGFRGTPISPTGD